MAPPFFSEFGRAVLDLFNNGYPFGLFRVNAGVRTCGNVSVGVGGAIKLEDWSMDSASVDCKYDVQPPRYKTSVAESWNLDNSLKLNIINCDLASYLPGMKIVATGSLDPATGKSSISVNPMMKTKYASMELGTSLGDEMPTSMNGSIVVGYTNWLMGCKGVYNIDESTLTANTIALGFCSPDIQVTGTVDNLEHYKLGVWHRTSDRVEIGLQASWKPGNPPPGEDSTEPRKPYEETGTGIALAGRVLLTPYTSIKGRICNDSQLAIGLETKLRENTILTLAGQIDGKSISGGNHKFGLGFEINGNFSSC